MEEVGYMVETMARVHREGEEPAAEGEETVQGRKKLMKMPRRLAWQDHRH